MRRHVRFGLSSALLACAFLAAGSTAEAAQVQRWFDFSGANLLWHWTETGKTETGEDVTEATLPRDMADPAKLTWCAADGTLLFEYRNYRPGQFAALNNWKANTIAELVSFNLTGLAAGLGNSPFWGEEASVTGIAEPSLYPDYDTNASGWFAQTRDDPIIGALAPTWWCESQVDAIDPTGTPDFTDLVAYTMDSSAVQPDGTVTFWIGGFVTADLAGLENGTAAFGILEGAHPMTALSDEDGDGYFRETDDCWDDPTFDLPICASCTCGVAGCASCARCRRPTGVEFPGDGIDSNCNGNDDCFIATASFRAEMDGKIMPLRDFRDLFLLTNRVGRRMVDFYYAYSPPVASFIAGHDAVRVVVRTALLPVVGASWLATGHCGGMRLFGFAMLTIVGLIGIPLAARAAAWACRARRES